MKKRPETNVKFRWGWLNTVKSDAGFSMKDRTLQGFVEYREDKRRAIVPIDNDFLHRRAYLCKDTVIKWKPPYDNETIPEEKRQQIIQNIYEALRFAGGPIEMAEGRPSTQM